MPIIALLRIRNEARWIERVVRSIFPVSKHVVILDDFSTDGTPDICESIDPGKVSVFRNAVPRLIVDGQEVSDESAGKDFLLSKAYELVPEFYHNERSPYWALAIDGDEELHPDDQNVLLEAIANPDVHCYALKILYLWNRPNQWRTDGVYGRFARPSLFRLINPAFRYQRTPWGNGANFHCSSIPQEMLHHARSCSARLLHWGYMTREDRLRKHEFYNRVDPGNRAEDFYRHCIQGDVPEVPAEAQLKWAGPLQLEPLQSESLAA